MYSGDPSTELSGIHMVEIQLMNGLILVSGLQDSAQKLAGKCSCCELTFTYPRRHTTFADTHSSWCTNVQQNYRQLVTTC